MRRDGGGGMAALMIVAAMGVMGFMTYLATTGGPEQVVADEPAPHLVEPGADMRTVLVASTAPTMPSNPSGPLSTELLEGTLPTGATTATVLTDENCEPDAQGISHCLNRMRLADGSEIAVRHNHRMHEVSCLSPGEMVNVQVV